MIDRRHEYEKASRHRRVRGEARALGADRLLRDLDDDLLAFFQELLDFRLRTFVAVAIAASASAGPASAEAGSASAGATVGGTRPTYGRALAVSARRRYSDIVFVRLETVELLEGRYDIGNVEEAVALETEVNERRLHAGQHF